MSLSISRRSFLQGVGAAALPALSWSRVYGANSKLRVASIGTGGRGKPDLLGVAASPEAQIVALRNIDSSEPHLGWAAKQFTSAKTYADWRRLLDDEKNFDAVIVATPDHMHAPIAMPAMQLHKHVYCEKPLTHTIFEARQMKAAAQKYGVKTQMGNQIQSTENYRTAVKLVHDGAIGKVKEVHAWQAGGMKWLKWDNRPAGSDPIPEGFVWDNWLGTAPERPYKKGVYHAWNWRAFQDFSNGQLGDFGCHILDPVFMALNLTAPASVKGSSSTLNHEVWYKWSKIEYTFPGTDMTAGKTVNVTWYDGEGKFPDRKVLGVADSVKLPNSGSVMIGEKGSLLVPHVNPKPTLLSQPDAKFAMVPKIDHHGSWVDACRGVGTTASNFDYASGLTETVLLGTIAIRCPGEALTWDSAALRIPNSSKANALLTKPYRKGWEPKWV